MNTLRRVGPKVGNVHQRPSAPLLGEVTHKLESLKIVFGGGRGVRGFTLPLCPAGLGGFSSANL